MAKAAKAATFTADEVQAIQATARRVWNEIGHDVVEANGGDEPDAETIAEVVIDAGRLEQAIRSKDRVLADKVDANANVREVERIVRKAF
jgi:hypothetical protein